MCQHARASAGAIADVVEEIERIDLWVVIGSDIQSPKVFAISKKEPHMKAAQEVLHQWAGGVVGQATSMEDGEPTFALGLQSSSTILFEDKVCSLDVAWKQALASTQGVNMWGSTKPLAQLIKIPLARSLFSAR